MRLAFLSITIAAAIASWPLIKFANKSSTPYSLAVFIALCLFSVCLPFSNSTITAAGLLLLLAFIAYIVFDKGYKKFHNYGYIFWGWLAVYLVRLIWLMHSPNVSYGMQFLDSSILYVVFPVSFSFFCIKPSQYQLLLKLYIRAMMLFCAFTLICTFYNINLHDISLTEWLAKTKANRFYKYSFEWANHYHPSYIAIPLVFGVAISIYLKMAKQISAVEVVLYSALVFAVCLLTNARIGIIALLFVLATSLLFYVKSKKARFLLIAIYIAAAAIVLKSGSFTNFINDPARSQFNNIAIQHIKTNFWFGTGTGGMLEIFQNATNVRHPHNQFLGEILHFGIIGASVLISLLIYAFIYAFKRKNYLLIMLLGIETLFMAVEMPLDLQTGISYFLFFYCLVIVGEHVKTQTSTK